MNAEQKRLRRIAPDRINHSFLCLFCVSGIRTTFRWEASSMKDQSVIPDPFCRSHALRSA